jgi:hypothetical protein
MDLALTPIYDRYSLIFYSIRSSYILETIRYIIFHDIMLFIANTSGQNQAPHQKGEKRTGHSG